MSPSNRRQVPRNFSRTCILEQFECQWVCGIKAVV